MLNPLNLTIDESVLATPKSRSSAIVVEKYTSNLMKLGELLQEGVVEVYMSQGSFYSINTKQRYSYERLREFFYTHNGGEYSSREAMIMMRYIRDRISIFEDRFEIYGVSVDGNIKTVPEIEEIVFTKRRHMEIKKCILMIAILLDSSDKRFDGHALALVCEPTHRITVEARVRDIKSQNPKTINLPRSPDIFRGDVPVLEDLSTLKILLDAAALMGTAIGKQTEERIFDLLFRGDV